MASSVVSSGPTGAGAGQTPAATYFPKRPPTEQELIEIDECIEDARESGDIRGIRICYLDFLKANPKVDTDKLAQHGTRALLYQVVLWTLDPEHPLFQEILKRNPDFQLVDSQDSLTALEKVTQMCSEFHDRIAGGEAQLAPIYERCKRIQAVLQGLVKGLARNLKSLQLTSKGGLENRGLPEYVVGNIKGFLTGTGRYNSNAVRMSKLRVKAGLPGVPIEEQKGGRKSRRKRRSKRKTTRKHKLPLPKK